MEHINTNYKYSEETSKIIACALEVHKILGNGFQACLPKGSSACRQEVIYQRALSLEMLLQGIDHKRELEMDIFYKGEKIGTRRVDFLILDKISVEIKAIIKLEDIHLAQVINYLEAYNLEVGLLINFGAKSSEFKRVMNKKYHSTS